MPIKGASSLTKTSSAMTTTKAAQAAALTLNLDDIGRLAIALAIVAADEVEENSRFAHRVQTTYEMLPPSKTRPTTKTDMPAALTSTLIPIKRVEGGEINPLAPLNPELLLEVYGPRQLRDALDLYPVAKVREGAAALAERYPGSKPTARASKAKLIDYIIERLVPEA